MVEPLKGKIDSVRQQAGSYSTEPGEKQFNRAAGITGHLPPFGSGLAQHLLPSCFNGLSFRFELVTGYNSWPLL
ncbi:hypothetical protein HNQ53_001355 [Microbulbifer hydrolyticus]|uniref:Uncharacterized protein n=1 Tax=Microbulbifer hydrolyticus TaxID=48074 RepID=A0AA89PTY5_9GAMM|nr:hypothetical protein [Microbulbifer hydrolyticus]